MKIERLIGILSILLQEEKVTAPELAKRFEVSRRTINRDIEDLCMAGIPICTAQGAGGGIRIMDGYRMDRTLLTSKDLQMILAGLRSLDSVSGSHYYEQLMEKIKAGSSDLVSGKNSILIDLSSWYKESLTPKIEMIQAAIEERRYLFFRYYAPNGESSRKVEPYYLIFKWSSWYLWGWCSARETVRLFKLNRMDEIRLSSDSFIPREIPAPDLSNEKIFPERMNIKAVFQPEMKWHLIEEFGAHCFEIQPDGTLLFQREYTDRDSLISWMLTLGDQVEVLEPESVRRELLQIAKNVIKMYEKADNGKRGQETCQDRETKKTC